MPLSLKNLLLIKNGYYSVPNLSTTLFVIQMAVLSVQTYKNIFSTDMQTINTMIARTKQITTIEFVQYIYEYKLIHTAEEKNCYLDTLDIQCPSFSKYSYRISVNSFRGNYSFLNLALCTVTFGHCT
jgi:hypothetical protein